MIATLAGKIVCKVNRAGVPGWTPGVFFPFASISVSIKTEILPSASGVAVRVQSFPSRLRCFGVLAESSTTPQFVKLLEDGLLQPGRSKTLAANTITMVFFIMGL